MSTAPMANTRGLKVSISTPRPRSSTTTPLKSTILAGSSQNVAAATRIAEMIAEMKKPRLMADMPERSVARGETAKMPMTAVTHADGGDDQRVDQADLAEGRLAQDQGGDERDGVGLEEVGRHAGAVADVVADVVGDGRRVARVVLGDALLDLADEVGADVGSLGEDAAADSHEHGEQRGAEAEALEDLGRLALVDEHDEGRAEQAEADREHAGHAAGAEGDLHGLLLAAVAGRRGDAHVAADRQPHAGVAGDAGEDRADDEEDAAPDALARGLRRQQEQHEEDDHGEDGEGLELPGQVRRGALLDRAGDLLHVVRALVGGKDLAHQEGRDAEGGERDDGNDDDDRQVAPGQLDHGSPRYGPERGRYPDRAGEDGGSAPSGRRSPAESTHGAEGG